jgi:hypothetical protein
MAKTLKTPTATKKEDAERNHYPTIEKLFESGTLPAFLQKAEQTCRELDALIDSGNQREAARARAAMAGYGKTLELLQELRGLAEAQDDGE